MSFEQQKTNQELTQELESLKQEMAEFKKAFFEHAHVVTKDKTQPIKGKTAIEYPEYLDVGVGYLISQLTDADQLGKERSEVALIVGREKGFDRPEKSINSQLTLGNYVFSTTLFQTQFNGRGRPQYMRFDRLVSITAGGNTITDNGMNWNTNELSDSGCFISVVDPTVGYLYTRKIASNTATQITITGTWNANKSVYYLIYAPVYLGSPSSPFGRLAVMEGDAYGVAFGTGDGILHDGVTEKRGFLWMDAVGDLYWKNKSGTNTKLN